MAKNQSFRDYIKNRRITDTPAGDFVSDANNDQTLPDVQTWEELQGYLRGKTRHPEVIDAARTVWRQYIRCKGS